jgi:hypothetical protein
MPAISVARTDTFEKQREKINEISTQIFTISQGGSDLSTGILRLGDGLIGNPSLGFTNETALGFFRPVEKTVRWVSSGKKLLDIAEDAVRFYKNSDFVKQELIQSGLTFTSTGTGYEGGAYTNIDLVGGTGTGGTIDLVVTGFTGTTTNTGAGYLPGAYTSIPLIVNTGSGSGAVADITVDGLQGDITNAGNGYKPGNYTAVPLTGGTGSSATADIEIQGGTTGTGSITTPGSSYENGTYEDITVYNQAAQTFVVTVTGSGPYQYVIDGSSQPTLTLNKGNTYKFDLSDSSNATHVFNITNATGNLDPTEYYFVKVGNDGSAGAFGYLVVKPSASTAITYECTSHAGMGGNFTLATGGTGLYGVGFAADFTVAGGAITAFTLKDGFSSPVDYNTNDVLEVSPLIFGFNGTGSGFTYTITGLAYTGTIFNVNVIDIGSGYVFGDPLSASDSNLGGAGGANFLYTVNTYPQIITDEKITFSDKGTGYAAGEILSLPGTTTGVNATLNGQVTDITATLGTGTSVTVSDTTGIVAGMVISVQAGGVGSFPFSPDTTVVNVINATTIVVSQAPDAAGAATLDFNSPNPATDIVLSSVVGIVPNSVVTKTGGTGVLAADTTVNSISADTNTITLNNPATTAGPVTLTFTPPYGSPTTDFAYTINAVGVVESFLVNNAGLSYSVGDTLSVSPFDIVQPTTFLVTSVQITRIDITGTVATSAFQVGDTITSTGGGFGGSETVNVLQVFSTGSTIDYIIVESSSLTAGDAFDNDRTSTGYTANTVDNEGRFKIGGDFPVNQTIYSGDTYIFDISDSSMSGKGFKLSAYRDGIHSPSKISTSSSFTDGSAVVTMASTTGILVGMDITITDFTSTVVVPADTTVQSIDGAGQITLTNAVTNSGNGVATDFVGKEFTDGIESSSTQVKLKVTDTTPTLYIYGTEENAGGFDNDEWTLTSNTNNPRVFGSGFLITVDSISSSSVITSNLATGAFGATTLTATDVNATNLTLGTNGVVTAPTVNATAITAETITSAAGLAISATSGVNFLSDVTFVDSNVATQILIEKQTGKITAKGDIKTEASFNSNDALTISNNTIASAANTNIVLAPSTGSTVTITSTGSLVIPAGDNANRPTDAAKGKADGAIRYNTQTLQYEGYSGSSSSWSSLGGVRDLDGNTYMLAEETIGANDNNLWFINDNVNTLRVSPFHLEFVNMKKIRSVNVSAPAYVNWNANTPVTVGQYLKWKNNLYEVTGAGTTATSGSEPTHTSGALVNGTATLTYSQIAVAPLTFEDIEELRIGPTGGLPLVINGDLRLATNILSTDINDLVLQPNTGKKVNINSVTSLVVPNGTTAQRGTAEQGSVRFNTTDSLFEGYDGSNWGSLGGVKDVDQNTYIIPELSAGSNENILYFYNDGANSLQLTKTALDFYAVDTIRSQTSNQFEITANLMTFNNADTTFDNTAADKTFLHTSKQYFDLGVSTGVYVDPILRLDDQGDVYLNTGFGTGNYNGVKVFDGDLKEFELADIKILSEVITLIKGSSNSGGSNIYTTSTAKGAKVVVVAEDIVTNEKEFIEFGVTDDGTDVFHTEYGNLRTDYQLIVPTFEYTATNEARLNITLGANVPATNSVKITFSSTITKK